MYDLKGADSLFITPSADLISPGLMLASNLVDDLEDLRIRETNRLRSLTRHPFEGDEGGFCAFCDERLEKGNHGATGEGTDADGIARGKGQTKVSPEIQSMTELVDNIKALEATAIKNLEKQMKNHPLGPWAAGQKGIGNKQIARLLAVVGDPYTNSDGDPVTVSGFWTYCGYGDPAIKRRKGMSQEDIFKLGNPKAKMRTYLISVSVWKSGIREGSPTNDLVKVAYDRKQETEGKLHDAPCVRCGPSGRPAEVGTPWSNGHRHADAMRVLSKEILRLMWIEARRLHAEAAGVSVEKVADEVRARIAASEAIAA